MSLRPKAPEQLISHIANATFSSLIRTINYQNKQNRLKITAFKQKTFRIVKERTMRGASRDHSSSGAGTGPEPGLESSRAAYRGR
jgi:hypothetical protein